MREEYSEFDRCFNDVAAMAALQFGQGGFSLCAVRALL